MVVVASMRTESTYVSSDACDTDPCNMAFGQAFHYTAKAERVALRVYCDFSHSSSTLILILQ